MPYQRTGKGLFESIGRSIIGLACCLSYAQAEDDFSRFFAGLGNVHGIHEVICPESDSGIAVVLNLESFLNINKYEFNLMDLKCRAIGSHIENDGQLLERDPGKRKWIHLAIGLAMDRGSKNKLVLEYSDPIGKRNAKEVYKLVESGDILVVSDRIQPGP